MINNTDYEQLDAYGLAQGIRDKRFSAVEVIHCAISKAEALNPQLNALCWRTYDKAVEAAESLDNNPALLKSPLAGVPFLYKDISAVKGLPQTNQSALFSNEVATYTSAIVNSFDDSGLISLGKSNTPEFCLTLTTEPKTSGACRNPWHPDHSTGGSSGGSAAAVAAGIVPLAHATDGGGSIRIPASCCGVFGLKPSRGLTPVAPELSGSWSGMSVGHVVSRSVRDSALVLDAIKLHKPLLYPLPDMPNSFLNALSKMPDISIAVQRQHPFGALVHPEVASSLNLAVDVCQQLGFKVIDAEPPVNYRDLSDFTGRIINTHVAQTIYPQLEKLSLNIDTDLLEEGSRRMAVRGAEISACDYVKAIDGMRVIAQQMNTFHQQHDVLISPVITQPPARLGWLDMDADDFDTYIKRFREYSGFCSLANATGQPSMSVPIHQTEDGLPIGVMFTSKWGSDMTLLQLASMIEKQINWQKRRPKII